VQASRKLVAIFSSDVFGYSRLMSDDEQATLDAIVDTRQVVAAHVAQHAGRVVDTSGDAVLAEFPSATEAVRCACEIQRELALRNAKRAEHRRMHLRIGLNLGDVIERDGALYGDGVNIAARLQTAGEPGGVCISGSIREQVEGKLPLRFESVGERHFKNIDRAISAFHVRQSADIGGASTAAFSTFNATTPARPRGNLPQPLSSFVGRASDIAAVKQMLARQRLVTLLGPGGIGKTRLSLQVAADVVGDFPDGVWLVELAALADPRLVKQAVATVLGVKEEAGRPLIEALLRALVEKRLLVILDNCEHLLQGCAELAQQLLQTAAGVKVLASSREPLRVGGEASYLVPALATPDTQQALAFDGVRDFEAVQLFVERAVAAQPAFELSPQNSLAVVGICRRLDGIPLAIELAASRVRALSVENIAARLSDRFHLLTRGDRNALPRQQTLRAMIDWSHDLFSEPERVLYRRLAVFAGGWTLEAAEAVGAADASEARELPDLLSRLVERSMVEAEVGGRRYRLLQSVRQHAAERLDSAGEGDTVRERHLAFYLALAEAASAQLSGPEQGQWLERLDPEQENFLTAHRWCDHSVQGAEAGLRLMFALKLYLFNRGFLAPLHWGTRDALARPGAQARTIVRCRALHTAGQVAYFMGRFDDARAQLEEALGIAYEIGDTGRAASVLQTMGMTCVGLGERLDARRYLEQALSLVQARGDQRELAAALNALAQLHRVEGRLDAAEPLYAECLLLTRQLGDQENTAVALLNLAMVAMGRGMLDGANDMLLEALGISEAVGSKLSGGNVIAVSAGLASLRGDWAQAAWFTGAAKSQLEKSGNSLEPADEAFLAPLVESARQALESGTFAAALDAAFVMPYEQAIDSARLWLRRNSA